MKKKHDKESLATLTPEDLIHRAGLDLTPDQAALYALDPYASIAPEAETDHDRKTRLSAGSILGETHRRIYKKRHKMTVDNIPLFGWETALINSAQDRDKLTILAKAKKGSLIAFCVALALSPGAIKLLGVCSYHGDERGLLSGIFAALFFMSLADLIAAIVALGRIPFLIWENLVLRRAKRLTWPSGIVEGEQNQLSRTDQTIQVYLAGIARVQKELNETSDLPHIRERLDQQIALVQSQRVQLEQRMRGAVGDVERSAMIADADTHLVTRLGRLNQAREEILNTLARATALFAEFERRVQGLRGPLDDAALIRTIEVGETRDTQLIQQADDLVIRHVQRIAGLIQGLQESMVAAVPTADASDPNLERFLVRSAAAAQQVALLETAMERDPSGNLPS